MHAANSVQTRATRQYNEPPMQDKPKHRSLMHTTSRLIQNYKPASMAATPMASIATDPETQLLRTTLLPAALLLLLLLPLPVLRPNGRPW